MTLLWHSVAECSAALQAIAVRLMARPAVGACTRRICASSSALRLARSGTKAESRETLHR